MSLRFGRSLQLDIPFKADGSAVNQLQRLVF